MEKIKMRSRMFPDLTNWEIEEYLKRNDLILVPVGNCEVHGEWPVDCEYVFQMGYAKLIAEECDGLVLPGLNYFHPGGTQTGRGTVHMGMTQGLEYCLALAHSLLDQGFKRQIWIPSHQPTSMFLLAMVTQFFDETHVPIMFLDLMKLQMNRGLFPKEPMGATTTSDGRKVVPFEDCMLAGYTLTGRLEAVPAIGEVDFPEVEESKRVCKWDNSWFAEYDILQKAGNFGAPAPFYFPNATDHGGYPVPKCTRAELEELTGQPVYLDLWVKVSPHWRQTDLVLRRLGYGLQ